MTKAIKAIEAALDAVPNGTDIITPEVASYVDRYRHFAKQTAESIINLALTLYEAEDKLSPIEFALFCDQVSIEQKGATYRKLKAIAKNAARFMPVIDRLPNTWTTIYKLSTLPADQFTDLVEGGIISPFMTVKEINEQVNGTKKKEVNIDKHAPDFEVYIRDMDPVKKYEIYVLLHELGKDYSCEVIAAESLENELIALRRSQAA